MRENKKILSSLLKFLFICFFLVVFSYPLLKKQILAEECRQVTEEELNSKNSDQAAQLLRDVEKACQDGINNLQGQQKTLASAITFLDNKIYLTTTQIAATEQKLKILAKEIDSLSNKIEVLNKTIAEVSTILSSRIEATYKRGKIKPVYLLFSSQGFSNFLTRLKYLKVAQTNDRQLLYKMEESKLTYDQQKKLKEEKQAEQQTLQTQLVSQKANLAQQKVAKEELLKITKNEEKRYQQLLAAARAEIEALQSIIAGQGDEVKVGDIKEGDKIASIIVGASPCSTGTHLHFEVVKNESHNNPASYLKSISVEWDNCWLGDCDSPFSFSGSWNWPINGKPRITQGYGMTAYARWGAYGGGPHTGIDMVSDDLILKAVKEGTLYRGSIACGGGTLRYVKVEHKDSDVATYYAHVNYY